MIGITKVHPVEEWLDGRWVWDWEEDDRMGGWRRKEAGQSASGDSERDGGGLKPRCRQVLNEVDGRDPAKKTSEEDRLGGQVPSV
jgi:hypothetical protein